MIWTREASCCFFSWLWLSPVCSSRSSNVLSRNLKQDHFIELIMANSTDGDPHSTQIPSCFSDRFPLHLQIRSPALRSAIGTLHPTGVCHRAWPVIGEHPSTMNITIIRTMLEMVVWTRF
jgi:hypothetical protein